MNKEELKIVISNYYDITRNTRIARMDQYMNSYIRYLIGEELTKTAMKNAERCMELLKYVDTSNVQDFLPLTIKHTSDEYNINLKWEYINFDNVNSLERLKAEIKEGIIKQYQIYDETKSYYIRIAPLKKFRIVRLNKKFNNPNIFENYVVKL